MSSARSLSIEGIGITGDALPPIEQGRIDPRSWFEHPDRRFEIEIGVGKGTFLVQQASIEPQTNFLGFEWAGEYFRHAADRVRRRALTNVRIVYGDGAEFIRHRCVDGCCAVIHLYFSDPWPKKRHHKRRVVQDESLAEFHRVLVPGGELRIVTDHDDLWAWCQEHLARHAHLFEERPFAPPASAGADEVVGSNFERKYRREGRPFHAVTLAKR